jgi:acyl carrier protein
LALLDALRADPACPAAIGAIPADWTRFRASAGDTTPRLASLTPAADDTPPAANAIDRVDLQSLLALAPAARATTLRTMIRRTLATVLGFDESTAEISTRAKYFDLGMDSLMAVEFRNRLQQTFEIPLPATMAFDYPTIETLAESIGTALAARVPAAATTTPESSLVAPSSDAAVLDADLLDALPAHEIARLLASELDEEGRHV